MASARCWQRSRLLLRHVRQASWLGYKWLPHAASCLLLGLGILLVYFQSFAVLSAHADANQGYGPELLNCFSTLWPGSEECGPQGQLCMPFESQNWVLARCGPRCGWERNLVPEIYGTGPFHAASPVCLAAVFEGLIPAGGQGCVEYRLSGAQQEFRGGRGHAGLHARPYPSSFPRSFELRAPPQGTTGGHCGGPGWPTILPVSLVALLVAGLIVLPSRALWWGWLVTWGFWYVLFVSQPLAQVYFHLVEGSGRFMIAGALCALLFLASRGLKGQLQSMKLEEQTPAALRAPPRPGGGRGGRLDGWGHLEDDGGSHGNGGGGGGGGGGSGINGDPRLAHGGSPIGAFPGSSASPLSSEDSPFSIMTPRVAAYHPFNDQDSGGPPSRFHIQNRPVARTGPARQGIPDLDALDFANGAATASAVSVAPGGSGYSSRSQLGLGNLALDYRLLDRDEELGLGSAAIDQEAGLGDPLNDESAEIEMSPTHGFHPHPHPHPQNGGIRRPHYPHHHLPLVADASFSLNSSTASSSSASAAAATVSGIQRSSSTPQHLLSPIPRAVRVSHDETAEGDDFDDEDDSDGLDGGASSPLFGGLAKSPSVVLSKASSRGSASAPPGSGPLARVSRGSMEADEAAPVGLLWSAELNGKSTVGAAAISSGVWRQEAVSLGRRAVLYNWLLYALPYAVALHLNWLLFSGTIPDMNLDRNLFTHGATGLLVLILFVLVIGAVVLLHAWLLWKEPGFRWAPYLKFYGVAFGLLLAGSLILQSAKGSSAGGGDGYFLHLHHYFSPILLWPSSLTGLRKPPASARQGLFRRPFTRLVTTVWQAALLGVMVNGLSAWGAAPMWSPVAPELSLHRVFDSHRHPGYLRLAAPRNPTNVTLALPRLPISNGLELPFAPGGHTVLGAMVTLNGVELLRWYFPPPAASAPGLGPGAQAEDSQPASDGVLAGQPSRGVREARAGDATAKTALARRNSTWSSLVSPQESRLHPRILRDFRVMRMAGTAHLAADVRRLHDLAVNQRPAPQNWWLPPPTMLAAANDTVLFVLTGLQPATTYSFRTAWILDRHGDGRRLGPLSYSQLIRTPSTDGSGATASLPPPKRIRHQAGVDASEEPRGGGGLDEETTLVLEGFPGDFPLTDRMDSGDEAKGLLGRWRRRPLAQAEAP